MTAPDGRAPNAGVNRSLLLSTLAALSVVLAGLSSTPARAALNDIALRGLLNDDGTHDDLAFRGLVRELGLVMTPSGLQPAETTGQSGFDFGFDYTFHTMNFDESYWVRARESITPLLMTVGARARKGIVLPVPLASEVELGAQWLIDSQLLAMNSAVRIALHEGFRYIPDLAVQAGINRMVGDKDLDLLTVTAGAQVSKSFGVAGTFNLCPYFGYTSIWVNGSSRVIDAGPQNPGNIDDSVVFTAVDITENRLDRFSAGLRVTAALIQVLAGVDVNRVEPVAGPNAGGPADFLLQYGIRTGLAF